jgi:hypothetical protein
MECADLRAALLSGQAPRGAEVDAHVRDCEACAELLREDMALGRELAELARSTGHHEPAPALGVDFAGIQAALAGERSVAGWLRSRSTLERVGLLLFVVLAVTLVELFVRRRVDFGLYPTVPLLVMIAAFSLLIGLAVAACLRPLQETRLSPWAERGLIAAGVLMPVLFYAGEPVHTAHPASLAGAGGQLLERAGVCFVYGLLLALPVLVLARLLDRAEHRVVSGALCAALSGGLTANLALHLHCPITHAGHLLLGHASLIVALIAAYASWASRAGRAR